MLRLATTTHPRTPTTTNTKAVRCSPGGEVIVSRGQLVEIGGSYRIPDVMEKSGATLVAVGTTNRTRLSDYERAIGPKTRAILRVHPSNYRIVGFAEETPLADLVALGKKANVPVIDDLGSGALVDLSRAVSILPTDAPVKEFTANVATFASVLAADPVIERQLDLVRDEQWLGELAHDIASTSGDRDRLTFRLMPHQLGRLDIDLSRSHDGLSLTIRTENDSAQAILSAAQPRLAEEIRAQGLKLADTQMFSGDARQSHAQTSNARAVPLIEALDRYRAAHKSYPDRLQKLVPAYLPELPGCNPRSAGSGIAYTVDRDSGEYYLNCGIGMFAKRQYSSRTRRWSTWD